MMLYPDINELLTKVDTRYTLCIEVAKRARQLNEDYKSLVDVESNKNVSIAVEEIYQDKVSFIRTKDGIK